MKQLLNNLLSVLFLQPDRYRAPPHPALAAGLCAFATVATALLAFGAPALWVVGFAHLIGLAAFPCKAAVQKAPPDDDQLGGALARALFASMVATWPLGLAVAGGLPLELTIACALHGVVQIWLQVELPRRPVPAAAERRFTRAGPPIGRFDGSEIAAWLIDAHGIRYDFVGCTADPVAPCLDQGQTVLRPGIIYQARQRH